MEKIPKYIILILMVIGYLSVRAQDASTQPVFKMDPKLSPEQGAPGSAVSINPAKPTTPPSDTKLNNEGASGMGETGSTIQKPPTDQLRDPKLDAEVNAKYPKEVVPVIKTKSKVSGTPAKESNSQPAGVTSKNIINYRNIKGPDTQPEPPVKGKVINYREINGPNDQPKGTEPKK
jgi:hypothetical protein